MSKQEDRFTRRRLRTSYLTTVMSLSLVLFMLGLLSLIILQARKLSDYVRENIGFSIILKEDVKESHIMEMQKRLDMADYVKSTEYIPREQAARELMEDLGEDFVEFLGYNPLLPSLDVRLNASYANVDSLAVIEQQLLANSDVKEVFYEKNLVHLVNENLRRISVILLGFSSLLLLIAAALINNTIRLSVYSKRFIIRSMQLVGATQSFIRRPFVISGVLQGIYGAFTGLLFLSVVLYFIRQQLPEIILLQDVRLYLSVFGFVLLAGILLSWISTYFAVRKYLKINTDSLYT
ncbi:MAG TPA: permease-like cell division protein FtsX [Bacteroidales bacterium]|nr:permease-like cell division protein FtsX [Bacteroidales bacterium]HRZ76598.1 permease-like cell division protein FtsX [Bacteroidales bacterium]